MLKIAFLFSPSEDKNYLDSNIYSNLESKEEKLGFLKDLFLSNEEIASFREGFLKKYLNLIEDINLNPSNLKDIFGYKAVSNKSLFEASKILSLDSLYQAINLYSGVGYEGLNFKELDLNTKNFILENTIIFSNLFGPIKASNKIIFYKLKQGSKLLDLKSLYKPFKSYLDSYLKSYDVIFDLRANIYKKAYSCKKSTSFEFYKDGKIISHYSKLYRGKTLALIAEFMINQDLTKDIKKDILLKELSLNLEELGVTSKIIS